MPVAAPRAHTRLTSADRRAQLLDVARRLFAERPYAAVSTQEIADAAGIRRGLLHHYFGTKRALYLEVVRDMVRLPPPPRAGTWAAALDGWLTMVERNRGTWVTVLASPDPELAPILEAAREASAARVIEIVGAPETPAARAAVRAYGAAAEAATLEWLVRGRLTRAQVHALLLQTLPTMIPEEP